MCSSVSWKLIATAVPFALVGQEQDRVAVTPGRLRISADRGDVRLDRLGARAGEPDYSCVHDPLLSLGVPTLLGGRDPCCGVLLHSALLRPERVAASDDQNCERAVLLLDEGECGARADRVPDDAWVRPSRHCRRRRAGPLRRPHWSRTGAALAGESDEGVLLLSAENEQLA
jgi:hypothetical protein